MNKILILVVLIVAICVLVVFSFFGLQMLGLEGLSIGDDDNPEGTTELGLNDREIYQALCFLTDKDLPVQDTMSYIDGLHMKMYGINDQTAYDTLIWYEAEYQDDGYTSYADTVQRGSGWTAYHEIFYKDLSGKSVSIGDGSGIKTFYDYDTVVLTGYGPVTDYYDFAVMVASS